MPPSVADDAVVSPDESIAGQIRGLLGPQRTTLAENLVAFARLLRASDFDVTAGRVIDAARALALTGVHDPDDVCLVLRANFVSDMSRLAEFDHLFGLFWRLGGAGLDGPESVLAERRSASSPRHRQGIEVQSEPLQAHGADADNPEATASMADLITVKDFAGYTAADMDRARAIVRRLAPRLATAAGRRTEASRRAGIVDLRRSLRLAARRGGEVVELLRQRRRIRRLRLVLLCDVSGSMDVYSRYLVQFMYAVQNELRGVSAFVFSTRLSEITHLLKTRSYDEALVRLRADVDAWSGGTSIGGSLAAFERDYARRRVDSRTVLIIISDGWERGDVEALRRAMASLKRRTHKVLWLNPLLGSKDYRPLAKGMAAALPYVDYFLPAHNLDSLDRVARTLTNLARA